MLLQSMIFALFLLLFANSAISSLFYSPGADNSCPADVFNCSLGDSVCSSVRCSPIPHDACNEANGYRVQYGSGPCGCCDWCLLRTGYEGNYNPCSPDDKSDVVIRSAVSKWGHCFPRVTAPPGNGGPILCGNATYCATGRNLCLPKNDQDPTRIQSKGDIYCEYDKDMSFKLNLDLPDPQIAWAPNCTKRGDYEKVQCKNSKCFCSLPTGKALGNPDASKHSNFESDYRIFGKADWSERDNMTCACSQLHMRMTAQNNNDPNILFPACQANGNFNPIQCFDFNKNSQSAEVCWCVDERTGVRKSGVVPRKIKTLLPCAATSTIPMEKTDSCHFQLYNYRNVSRETLPYGTDMQRDIAECNPDGTYAPIQCMGTQCGCFSVVGEQKKSLSEQFGGPSNRTACRCILDADPNLECYDTNGGYRALQANKGLYYCVDFDGQRRTALRNIGINDPHLYCIYCPRYPIC